MDGLSAIPQASLDVAQQRFELLRTAFRWVSGYRKEGLAALTRKSRTDQGGRRLASAQLIQAIEGLALERRRCRSVPYTGKRARWPRSFRSASPAMTSFAGPCGTFRDVVAKLPLLRRDRSRRRSTPYRHRPSKRHPPDRSSAPGRNAWQCRLSQ